MTVQENEVLDTTDGGFEVVDPIQEEFDTKVAEIIGEVDQELYSACAKFAPFNSAHEGYAVLLEEVDKLWDEVRAKQGDRDISAMRKEACQVAAMAMRFMMDVCDEESGQA